MEVEVCVASVGFIIACLHLWLRIELMKPFVEVSVLLEAPDGTQKENRSAVLYMHSSSLSVP